MALTRSQAQSFYDRFGAKQDAQAFYEDSALDELIAHASFERAESVFELGCGTGRLAARLLARHLPSSASYLGVDLSRTMTDLAQQRIAPYGNRAQVFQSDGSMRFPLPEHSVDRVVSTYVLDLLSETDIREAISEARRVLKPAGKLCLAGLTSGVTRVSRLVSTLWSAVFRLHAPWVGGCRPVRLEPYLDPNLWSREYRNVVMQYGVPSEVFVAAPRSAKALPQETTRRGSAPRAAGGDF